MARSNFSIPKAVVALAIMLSACSSGDGDSRAELRKLAGVEASPTPQIVLTPESTEPPVIVEVTREIAQPVEVTRIVEQPAQIIERTVEVVITATPDIQGFQDMTGVDESAQPCPAKYWKRNRCTATQAQIEAYAQGTVQP